MNGPQHYAEAERLIDETYSGPSLSFEEDASMIRRAQVHATLALTAATVQGQMDDAWNLHGIWGRTLEATDEALASIGISQSEGGH